MHAHLELSDEERAELRRDLIELLRGDLALHLAARRQALEQLTSFSAEEIAAAKGITVPAAKGLITKLGLSEEHLGYRTKRYPFRELKGAFDEATIHGLFAQRQQKGAAAA